jgi:hypothetical protein
MTPISNSVNRTDLSKWHCRKEKGQLTCGSESWIRPFLMARIDLTVLPKDWRFYWYRTSKERLDGRNGCRIHLRLPSRSWPNRFWQNGEVSGRDQSIALVSCGDIMDWNLLLELNEGAGIGAKARKSTDGENNWRRIPELLKADDNSHWIIVRDSIETITSLLFCQLAIPYSARSVPIWPQRDEILQTRGIVQCCGASEEASAQAYLSNGIWFFCTSTFHPSSWDSQFHFISDRISIISFSFQTRTILSSRGLISFGLQMQNAIWFLRDRSA